MRDIRRQEQRSAIVSAQLHHDVLAVGVRLGPHVDRHVDNRAARTAHQLGLGVRRYLTVQASQRASGVVVGEIRLRDSRNQPVRCRIRRHRTNVRRNRDRRGADRCRRSSHRRHQWACTSLQRPFRDKRSSACVTMSWPSRKALGKWATQVALGTSDQHSHCDVPSSSRYRPALVDRIPGRYPIRPSPP